MCYVAQSEAGVVRLFDGRRIALSLPSVDDMTDLGDITAPNGVPYSFVSTSVVNAFGLVKSADDLFVLVGTVCTCILYCLSSALLV